MTTVEPPDSAPPWATSWQQARDGVRQGNRAYLLLQRGASLRALGHEDLARVGLLQAERAVRRAVKLERALSYSSVNPRARHARLLESILTARGKSPELPPDLAQAGDEEATWLTERRATTTSG